MYSRECPFTVSSFLARRTFESRSSVPRVGAVLERLLLSAFFPFSFFPSHRKDVAPDLFMRVALGRAQHPWLVSPRCEVSASEHCLALSLDFSPLLIFKRSCHLPCPAFLLLLGLTGQFRMGRRRHCSLASREEDIGLWSALGCLWLCSSWLEPGREKGSDYAPSKPSSLKWPAVFCQNEIICYFNWYVKCQCYLGIIQEEGGMGFYKLALKQLQVVRAADGKPFMYEL